MLMPLWMVAQKHVAFPDPDTWTGSDLQEYVGQTVVFDQPVYICNNYHDQYTVSFHRIMSPTNQELPGSIEYNNLLTLNNRAGVTLTGLNGYHRMGEVFYGLTVKVNSTSNMQYISHEQLTGTRKQTTAHIPSIDIRGEHNLLICTMNCEYYLTEQFGSGSSSSMGPASDAEHQKQRTKVSSALSHIHADIYGLVEVQQGQGAIREIAEDLTRLTGRHYTYINDGGSPNGTYTKSGYVYCTDVVKPYGEMKSNNAKVVNRKKMQAFEVLASGERFIFSVNHFKAKSGTASGLDANQGDGQGTFNHSRVEEAQSVIAEYAVNRTYYGDPDLLIMGDLNAYGKEDPIITLTDAGMTDLHRYFHNDSSYSYTYHGQAGYLDHALCNKSLLAQVTGMAAYHINSDESDDYTYDKSNDLTMFRCSDHDPILVGLRLGSAFDPIERQDASAEDMEIEILQGVPTIRYAAGGYYSIHDISGHSISAGPVNGPEFTINTSLQPGIYVFVVYVEHTVKRIKKFIQ